MIEMILFVFKMKSSLLGIFLTPSLAFSLVAPTSVSAEGGCPNGFVPVGGGYCRNIVCITGNMQAAFLNGEEDAQLAMKKYNLSCGFPNPVFGGKWGNSIIPKR
jgi:hypothetical protein